MDDLLARHRKEQRDLQSRITQKKKAASKKTRKGVNDECANMEVELKTRQELEVAELDGSAAGLDGVGLEDASEDSKDEDELVADPKHAMDTLEQKTASLEIADVSTLEPSSTEQPRKGNRQKARLARRAAEQEAIVAQAAEEAANLPDLKERERIRMVEEFKKRGLQEKEVAANGHCMYSAVADQMRQLGLGLEAEATTDSTRDGEIGGQVQKDDYKTVRRTAADYMAANSDDFMPFLEEPLDEYVRKIRETGEWGGQLELLALAKSYGININVLQGDGRVEKVQGGEDGAKNVWLAYYRHGFGLGEHYNSLRTSEPAVSNG